MQITLNNSEDFRQLFNIVKLVNEEFGNYSHSLHEQIKVLQNREEKYQTEIDGLVLELDDCKKEKQTLATLNSALSEEIERIKTQQSCDEAVIVRDTVIDDLRAELKATIEENGRHKEVIRYLLELQAKLCEVVKRQFPLFDFERWLADYEKEKARINKEQKRAKKHQIDWNKIKDETSNERPNNQST